MHPLVSHESLQTFHDTLSLHTCFKNKPKRCYTPLILYSKNRDHVFLMYINESAIIGRGNTKPTFCPQTTINAHFPLFLNINPSASCKEIIPSLQEIVARILFRSFPFTAQQLWLLRGCYLDLNQDCYPAQQEMPPLSQRGANSLY